MVFSRKPKKPRRRAPVQRGKDRKAEDDDAEAERRRLHRWMLMIRAGFGRL